MSNSIDMRQIFLHIHSDAAEDKKRELTLFFQGYVIAQLNLSRKLTQSGSVGYTTVSSRNPFDFENCQQWDRNDEDTKKIEMGHSHLMSMSEIDCTKKSSLLREVEAFLAWPKTTHQVLTLLFTGCTDIFRTDQNSSFEDSQYLGRSAERLFLKPTTLSAARPSTLQAYVHPKHCVRPRIQSHTFA